MMTTRTPIPAIFESADIEVVWAVLAHRKENPDRSFRKLARLSGCSHPHAAKIVRSYVAEPDAIETFLRESGFWL